MLLDEPFGALDPGVTADMHQLILKLWNMNKMTIVMVTHDLKESFYLGTRLLVFDKVRFDPPGAGPVWRHHHLQHPVEGTPGGEPSNENRRDQSVTAALSVSRLIRARGTLLKHRQAQHGSRQCGVVC